MLLNVCLQMFFSVGKHTFYCTEEKKLQLEFNSIASPVFSHTKQQHVDLSFNNAWGSIVISTILIWGGFFFTFFIIKK